MKRGKESIVLTACILAATALSASAQSPSNESAPSCHKDRPPAVVSVPVKLEAKGSCLISAKQVGSGPVLVDLRSRQDFSRFHIPGAINQQLNQLLSQRPRGAVVYDAGKLTQDAELLCERLQRYGLQDVRVIDGGIAAWSQLKAPQQALVTSRLDDREVASALLGTRGQVVTLSPGFTQVLALLPPARKLGGQTFVLATSEAEASRHLASRKTGGTALYWIGEPARLHELIEQLVAQDRKRESGPGYSPTCSAL